MTTLPQIDTQTPGRTMPGVSVLDAFVIAANAFVGTLQQLTEQANNERRAEAAAISAFTATVAGLALDHIAQWPS